MTPYNNKNNILWVENTHSIKRNNNSTEKRKEEKAIKLFSGAFFALELANTLIYIRH